MIAHPSARVTPRIPQPPPVKRAVAGPFDDRAVAGTPWPLAILYYLVVWSTTFVLAHWRVEPAIMVGGSMVIVPGLYILSRVRLERVAPMFARGGW